MELDASNLALMKLGQEIKKIFPQQHACTRLIFIIGNPTIQLLCIMCKYQGMLFLTYQMVMANLRLPQWSVEEDSFLKKEKVEI